MRITGSLGSDFKFSLVSEYPWINVAALYKESSSALGNININSLKTCSKVRNPDPERRILSLLCSANPTLTFRRSNTSWDISERILRADGFLSFPSRIPFVDPTQAVSADSTEKKINNSLSLDCQKYKEQFH